MLAWVALATAAAAAVVPSVKLELVDAAKVRVRLGNSGDEPLAFLKWGTPFQPLLGLRRQYEVVDTTTGEAVPYNGPLGSYATAFAESYADLGAGEEAAAEVDLTNMYQFAAGHTYSVRISALPLRYAAGATVALLFPNGEETTKEEADAILAELALVTLSTAEAVSFVSAVDTEMPHEAARRRAAADKHEETVVEDASGKRRFSFQNCDSAEQTACTTAATNAAAGVQEALDYLGACHDYDYVQLFGTYSSTRLASVVTHYTNTKALFQSSNFKMYCNPSQCSPGVFAYVYPSDTATHTIHLCSAYWNAPVVLQRDSKPGTLVHEMTHFNDIGATDDHQYGYEGCLSLAISDPALAVDNADSHEYFVEFGKACCNLETTCGNCIGVNGCKFCTTTSTCLRTVQTTSCSQINTCAAVGDCVLETSCASCTSAAGCGWCETQQACVDGTVSGPSDASFCPNYFWEQCSGCGGYGSCSSCTQVDGCGWCDASSQCQAGSATGSAQCSFSDWTWTSAQCSSASGVGASVVAVVLAVVLAVAALL